MAHRRGRGAAAVAHGRRGHRRNRAGGDAGTGRPARPLLFWGRDYFGIDADSIAWRCGVTTWVDSGSAGAFSVPAFREYIAQQSAVNILAFINISYLGIPG